MKQQSELSSKWHRMEVLFELLVFGIVVGVIEDIVAIKLTTNEPITWGVVGIVILVAIPFAILGEVVFDRIDFASLFKRLFGSRTADDMQDEVRT